MRDLWESATAFLWGVTRRIFVWLPILLFDALQVWERYIDPVFPSVSSARAMTVLWTAGFLVAAFLTYHERRMHDASQLAQTEERLAGARRTRNFEARHERRIEANRTALAAATRRLDEFADRFNNLASRCRKTDSSGLPELDDELRAIEVECKRFVGADPMLGRACVRTLESRMRGAGPPAHRRQDQLAARARRDAETIALFMTKLSERGAGVTG
jgi:hypothetical protein